jgi:hypothetical protein
VKTLMNLSEISALSLRPLRLGGQRCSAGIHRRVAEAAEDAQRKAFFRPTQLIYRG